AATGLDPGEPGRRTAEVGGPRSRGGAPGGRMRGPRDRGEGPDDRAAARRGPGGQPTVVPPAAGTGREDQARPPPGYGVVDGHDRRLRSGHRRRCNHDSRGTGYLWAASMTGA